MPEPVQRALEKLQQLSADERTRELAKDREQALISWQLERNALLAEGEAKGKASGEAQAQQRIARSLLAAGLPVEAVATHTGLSVSAVQALAEEPPASS